MELKLHPGYHHQHYLFFHHLLVHQQHLLLPLLLFIIVTLFFKLITPFTIRVVPSQIKVELFFPPTHQIVISIFSLFHHPMLKDLKLVSTYECVERCNAQLIIDRNMFCHCKVDLLKISSLVLKFVPSQILSLLNQYSQVNLLLIPTQFQ